MRTNNVEKSIGIGDALGVGILLFVRQANEVFRFQPAAVDLEELCVFLLIIGNQARRELWRGRYACGAAQIRACVLVLLEVLRRRPLDWLRCNFLGGLGKARRNEPQKQETGGKTRRRSRTGRVCSVARHVASGRSMLEPNTTLNRYSGKRKQRT